jgi:hypothetical protein
MTFGNPLEKTDDNRIIEDYERESLFRKVSYRETHDGFKTRHNGRSLDTRLRHRWSGEPKHDDPP